MVRIASVEALEGLRVRLRFTDGTRRELDLTPYFRGPVFETLPFRADSYLTCNVSSMRACTQGPR